MPLSSLVFALLLPVMIHQLAQTCTFEPETENSPKLSTLINFFALYLKCGEASARKAKLPFHCLSVSVFFDIYSLYLVSECAEVLDLAFRHHLNALHI